MEREAIDEGMAGVHMIYQGIQQFLNGTVLRSLLQDLGCRLDLENGKDCYFTDSSCPAYATAPTKAEVIIFTRVNIMDCEHFWNRVLELRSWR